MPSPNVHRREAIETLSNLIHDIPVAMFATATARHELRSRPMVNVNTKFDGDLWFFTHQDDPKVGEITGNPKVNVSFVSSEDGRYVSVSGTASLVENVKRMETLWADECQRWFPKGMDDPKLALLHVDVHYAEYWDEKVGAMKELSGLVKHALGKDAGGVESVEHEKFDWEHATPSSGED